MRQLFQTNCALSPFFLSKHSQKAKPGMKSSASTTTLKTAVSIFIHTPLSITSSSLLVIDRSATRSVRSSQAQRTIISNEVTKTLYIFLILGDGQSSFSNRILLVFTAPLLSKPKRPIFLTSPKGSILVLHTKAYFISAYERASDGLMHMCTKPCPG